MSGNETGNVDSASSVISGSDPIATTGASRNTEQNLNSEDVPPPYNCLNDPPTYFSIFIEHQSKHSVGSSSFDSSVLDGTEAKQEIATAKSDLNFLKESLTVKKEVVPPSSFISEWDPRFMNSRRANSQNPGPGPGSGPGQRGSLPPRLAGRGNLGPEFEKFMSFKKKVLLGFITTAIVVAVAIVIIVMIV